MARNAPGAAREAREQLIAAQWDAPVLGRIVELVDQRAQWMNDIAAPAAPAPRPGRR